MQLLHLLIDRVEIELAIVHGNDGCGRELGQLLAFRLGRLQDGAASVEEALENSPGRDAETLEVYVEPPPVPYC